MRHSDERFEDLVLRLRAEVSESVGIQSLYIVGEGLILHNDGEGWICWFDRQIWDYKLRDQEPKAELACWGFVWSWEGQPAGIVQEILDQCIVPIPKGGWLWKRFYTVSSLIFDRPWEVVLSRGVAGEFSLTGYLPY